MSEKQITQLYVGYFNRCPDREGHAYWLSRFNAGMPLVDIASSFFVQPEAVAIYGGLERGALIDLIYANLFRRPPDAAGRQYWLTNGQWIVGTVSGELMQVGVTKRFTAGDVIRAHTGGTQDLTTDQVKFTIVKISLA